MDAEPDLTKRIPETQKALFRHLAERGFCLPDPQPLQGGRSNLVWRAGDVVVKIYRSERANLMFANAPERECFALQWLAGTGMVPNLRASGAFEGQPWLIYDHIEGTGWKTEPQAVAQLLAQLHAQSLPQQLPVGRSGSEALRVQTLRILEDCDDCDLLRSLEPKTHVAPCETHRVIHGDPVPGNIMVHRNGLTLIDWQCPQIGDPAEDLALFLSPAMQSLYRGAPLSQAEEEAFVDAYPDKVVVARLLALRPWFHWRMAAYCLWRGDKAEAALEIQSLRSLSASQA